MRMLSLVLSLRMQRSKARMISLVLSLRMHHLRLQGREELQEEEQQTTAGATPTPQYRQRSNAPGATNKLKDPGDTPKNHYRRRRTNNRGRWYSSNQ